MSEQAQPWKNEKFFDSFEQADLFRKSLKIKDVFNTLQIKVKRCGEGGKQFVVKSRIDKNAEAELEQIQEKMLTSRNKKSKK